MINSLKDILNRKVRATGGGLGERIKASVIVAAVDVAIAKVYPGAKGVRAKTFREGIVAVSCNSAVDAQEIKLKETEIMTEANSRLGASTITKLRVTC